MPAAAPPPIRPDTPPAPTDIPAATHFTRRSIREPVAPEAPPEPIAATRAHASTDAASLSTAAQPEQPQRIPDAPTTGPSTAPDVSPPVSIGEIHVHVTAPSDSAADPMTLLEPYANGLTARRAVPL
ncbi:hypothetical protein [Mycobacterium sp. SMC-17]|uniref:hypothetical protein n=1 Tax=Mycobacterium sp. SMC-17 TaxID=3381628 RepID=UPI0038773B7D